MDKHEYLREIRVKAGYVTASDAARAMGIPIPTYSHHENGTRDINAVWAARYSAFFGGDAVKLAIGPDILERNMRAHSRQRFMPVEVPHADEWEPVLLHTETAPDVSAQPNATIGDPLTQTRRRIPVLGEGVAGSDGRFVMNGQTLAEILCPPALEGVRDAYAVYIRGDSMSPRYESGETAYVNPHRPVRAGQYVVVQIRNDDESEPPFAYVKRFLGMSGETLRLEQLNPPEGEDRVMSFPREDVVSLHLIVGSGEG